MSAYCTQVAACTPGFLALEDVKGSNGWFRAMVGSSQRISYSSDSATSPTELQTLTLAGQDLSSTDVFTAAPPAVTGVHPILGCLHCG